MRCGQLVEIADRKIDVIMKCGEPSFEETRQHVKSLFLVGETEHRDKEYTDERDITIKGSGIYEKQRISVTVTDWTLNFGPGHFIQHITFENGKVTNIEQGDSGYR